MRVSLKNLKNKHPYFVGPVPTLEHIIVVAGGQEVIRVRTWVTFATDHAAVSLFGRSSGYGTSTSSRAGAIYKACENAGVVFQGEPRDQVKLMLKKLARSHGSRGKILILEV